ncbi:MAG: hypothetical protein LBI60_00090, partial [Bacteroidales bacterium]|nr:hypothetical protein [Bacteroidales bacterium]
PASRKNFCCLLGACHTTQHNGREPSPRKETNSASVLYNDRVNQEIVFYFGYCLHTIVFFLPDVSAPNVREETVKVCLA